ncbi:MAG: hypothetical protein LBV51_05190 [Acholeplasmatales bacterium]|jgi:hypothetical protein|nr:hypothetical protein [Acholeplasmatales bacterium]
MKKIVLCVLFMFVVLLAPSIKANSNYSSFEKLEVAGGKMLSDWTSSEYKDYLKKVSSRKFLGWNVQFIKKQLKATYITETLYSFYNDGSTAMEFHYDMKSEVKQKFDISVTGSLGINSSTSVKSKEKTFSNGLDTKIKAEVSYSYESKVTESYSTKILVDPGTQLDIYIYGEGKIYNGVAANYIFWIRAAEGGFEIFTVTTQYYRMEKRQI